MLDNKDQTDYSYFTSVADKHVPRGLFQDASILYSEFFQNADSSIVLINNSGTITDINIEASALFAMSNKELVGKDIQDLIPSRRLISVLETWPPGKSYVEINTTIATNRKKKKVALSIKPIVFEDGTELYKLVIHDLSGRDRLYKGISEHISNYEYILNNSLDGILILNKKMKLLKVNQTVASCFGYDSVESFEENYQQYGVFFIAPSQRDRFVEMIRSSHTGTDTPDYLNIRGLRKDGSDIGLRIILSSIKYKGENCVQVTIRETFDIDKKDETIFELEQMNKALYDTMSLSDIGIMVLQNEGQEEALIVSFNHAVNRIFGYSEDYLYMKSFFDILPSENRQRMEDAYSNILENYNSAPPYECNAICQDGTRISLSVSLSRIQYKNKAAVIVCILDVTKKTIIEKELQDYYDDFWHYFNDFPHGIFLIDYQGVFHYCNKQLEEIIGYQKEELIGHNYLDFDLIDEQDVSKAIKMRSLRKLSKHPLSDEFELTGKEGRRTWVQANIRNISLFGHNLVLGVLVNIDRYKTIESSVELISQILDVDYHAISLIDLNGNIVYTNKIFNEMHGQRDGINKIIKRKKIQEIYNIRDFNVVKELLTLSGERTFTNTIYKEDGSQKIVELTSHIIPSREKPLIVNIERDISRRVDYHSERIDSEILTDHLFKFSPIPIVIFGPDTSIVQVNSAFEKLSGYSSDELIGEKAPYPFLHNDLSHSYINLLMKEISIHSGDEIIQIRQKNGEEHWVEIQNTPIIRDGKTQYLITNWIDVTSRMKVEQSLDEFKDLNTILLEHSPNPIQVLSSDLSIKYTNPAHSNLTGYKTADIIGLKPPFPWWIDRNYNNDLRFLKKATIKHSLKKESIYTTQEGKPFWVDVDYSVVTNNNDNICIAYWTEVTERKRVRENQLAYISEITRAQEEERKRIARELHDDSVQTLASIALEIGVLSDENRYLLPGDVRSHITNAHTNIVKVLKDLRGFIHELRPGLLDQLGLIPVFEQFIEETNEEGNLILELVVSGTVIRLLPEVELILYRIMREAVRNIIKHSQATRATISLKFGDEKVQLKVSDKGIGFDFDGNLGELVKARKLGLIGIQERIRLVNGKLKIKTARNKGTAIKVEIPIKSQYSRG